MTRAPTPLDWMLLWCEAGRAFAQIFLMPRKEVVPDGRQHPAAHNDQPRRVAGAPYLRVIEGGRR